MLIKRNKWSGWRRVPNLVDGGGILHDGEYIQVPATLLPPCRQHRYLKKNNIYGINQCCGDPGCLHRPDPGFRVKNIRDPNLDHGSGSWFFTHTRSWIQGSNRHRILDPDSQHWINIFWFSIYSIVFFRMERRKIEPTISRSWPNGNCKGAGSGCKESGSTMLLWSIT